MNDHYVRGAIEHALVTVAGRRLHHYALTHRPSEIPTFGPGHADTATVAHTTSTLSELRARPLTPLPHVQHLGWRERLSGGGLTRVFLRAPGDRLVAVALHGHVARGQAKVLARELEAAVKSAVLAASSGRVARANLAVDEAY